MNDQADVLRQLVHRSGAASETGPRPALVTVAAGKGGLGTTTVALNLATALAQSGHRTVLVDADLSGGDTAQLCQLAGVYSIADVLAGRRTIHEVLERGPAGLQIVPGVWALGEAADASPPAIDRLLGQLDSLAPHADFVVIDAGSSLARPARRLWQAADQVLLVTTPDPLAVMDAYAAVKVQLADRPLGHVQVLVNQAYDAAIAADVYQRLTRASQRFLGHPLGAAGHIPLLRRGTSAVFVRDEPAGEAAGMVERLVAGLAEARYAVAQVA